MYNGIRYNMAVIQSFRDQGSADIFAGVNSKAARKCLPVALRDVARRRLDALDAATGLGDLAAVPGNQLHPLKQDREGQHSIRVNDQYRVCFTWTDRGPADVEVTDYH